VGISETIGLDDDTPLFVIITKKNIKPNECFITPTTKSEQ
jgi:hypothetical protein